MYKQRNKKKLLLSIFLLLLVAIGIGYAYLTSNLSITGATEVVSNTWNIHFENIQVKDGSVTATTSPTLSNNNTSITYTIDLNRPKEFYEFTVDVKNDGTLPGKVSISSLSGLDTTSSKLIDYSVTYTNGNPVNIGDILNAGSKKTIKVRTFYKDDITSTDFPANDLNLTLTYTLQYVQSEEDLLDTETLINKLKTENSSCIYQYTGAVTDEVGNTETVTAATSKVYFNRCADKRNIKFNNMCWQMIRTTQTGGIKMIYNGEVVDGKCESTRGNHKGIVGAAGLIQALNTSYLYGDSFTYDITNNTFTLTDTDTATWSDSTYEDLIGKFTCINTTGTCTTLYNVNSYSSNTTAYTSSYTIGDINYAQIGRSAFNANYISPAMVGYMFNKIYNYKEKQPSTTEYKYGSEFTYDTSTNTYTLSGTTQNISTWSSGYNTINNTHYTCWNTSGTCSTISYVYYTTSSYAYYIDITSGKSVSDAINEMLYDTSVNRYNSSIKGIIDAWYSQNLSSKTNMLEDTVYCNARNMSNQSTNGWNPNGGSRSTEMYFKNYTLNNDLSCSSVTDQFAVSNNKAKLTYPVSLATHEELYTLTNNNSSTYRSVLTKTGAWWWGLSPLSFFATGTSVRSVVAAGNVNDYYSVDYAGGVRLVVTLSTGAVISSGTGSEERPFVISE